LHLTCTIAIAVAITATTQCAQCLHHGFTILVFV
jgi:hypothetical protein